jgi:cardiolipin synthase A/B
MAGMVRRPRNNGTDSAPEPTQDDTPSSFRLLKTGAEGLGAMLAAIRDARHSIRLETYIFRDGPVGARFRQALSEARGRGVDVRVLVDAFGSFELPDRFWTPLRAAGADVRWFNPFSLKRWSYRDHRKLLVCDGGLAIVGGFNIADEYDGDGVTSGWRDLGLAVTGPLARELERTFDRMFARADFRHRRWQRLRKAQIHAVTLANGEALSSGPGCRHGAIKRALVRDLARADDVRIASAYFLPTWRLRRGLRRVVKRGGRVQLMLAGQSDMLLSHLAGRWLYRSLLRAGVEIFEYQPQILHAKLIVVDGITYVGSANLDTRSLSINYELLVRVRDPELTRDAAAMFDADLRHCRRIERQAWRRSRTWWSKLKESWSYFLLAKVDLLLARWQLKALR